MRRIIAIILALLCVMSLFAACGKEAEPETIPTESPTKLRTKYGNTAVYKTRFIYEVINPEGKIESYEIYSDQTRLDAALTEKALADIDSEGHISLRKYSDISGAYWKFYVNGVYYAAGVKDLVIEDGAVYSFAYTPIEEK